MNSDVFINSILSRFLGSASFVGFIASLIIHLGAIMGFLVYEVFPSYWLLHIFLFLPLGAYVFFSLNNSEDRRKGYLASYKELYKLLPKWAAHLIVFFSLYAAANFVFSGAPLLKGNPKIEGDKYITSSKGKYIKEISVEQYKNLRLFEVRLFSGHWMFFYFLPFAYFIYRKQSDTKTKDFGDSIS